MPVKTTIPGTTIPNKRQNDKFPEAHCYTKNGASGNEFPRKNKQGNKADFNLVLILPYY